MPEGLRSEMKGTRSETRWKSSSVSVMPTEWAMAMRCSTALVLPPVAITVTIAFSNAARVMMSRGRMSFFRSWSAYRPAMLHTQPLCRVVHAHGQCAGATARAHGRLAVLRLDVGSVRMRVTRVVSHSMIHTVAGGMGPSGV